MQSCTPNMGRVGRQDSDGTTMGPRGVPLEPLGGCKLRGVVRCRGNSCQNAHLAYHEKSTRLRDLKPRDTKLLWWLVSRLIPTNWRFVFWGYFFIIIIIIQVLALRASIHPVKMKNDFLLRVFGWYTRVLRGWVSYNVLAQRATITCPHWKFWRMHFLPPMLHLSSSSPAARPTTQL